jgi:hypothetical protein
MTGGVFGRPWDLMSNSTMTNAMVAQMVKGVEGDEITLKYKDSEKKIVVAPDTTIVTYGCRERRTNSSLAPKALHHRCEPVAAYSACFQHRVRQPVRIALAAPSRTHDQFCKLR